MELLSETYLVGTYCALCMLSARARLIVREVGGRVRDDEEDDW
jgi:hypothetical protein